MAVHIMKRSLPTVKYGYTGNEKISPYGRDDTAVLGILGKFGGFAAKFSPSLLNAPSSRSKRSEERNLFIFYSHFFLVRLSS